MKSIIIAGPGRYGKTTLARKINEKFGCFIINLDKLMTTFDRAYPQLDVRIAWDYDNATANVAPFIGHYLGMFSSHHGYAGDLNLHKHNESGNRFVLEGGHFDFKKISDIYNTYGVGELKDNFILIGLAQNTKTAKELAATIRKHDTEDEWTYDFSDEALLALCEDMVLHSQEMYNSMIKHGFTIYDTTTERETVFEEIIKDINLRSV